MAKHSIITQRDRKSSTTTAGETPLVAAANQARMIARCVKGLQKAREINDADQVDEYREMLLMCVTWGQIKAHRKLAKAALKLDEQVVSFAWRVSACGVAVIT